MLSQSRTAAGNPTQDTVTIQGVTYQRVARVHRFQARAQHAPSAENGLGLVDGGCNLCLMGSDAIMMDAIPNQFADFVGMNESELNHLPIGTCATVIRAQDREFIGIFHRAAYHGTGNSILSSLQLESFGCKVDDKPVALGGTQSVTTPDGHIVPLSIQDGLAYMPSLRIPTDADFDHLEVVYMTSDDVWDPSVFDSEPTYSPHATIHDPILHDLRAHSSDDLSTFNENVPDGYEEMEIEFYDSPTDEPDTDPELLFTSSCYSTHQENLYSCFLDAASDHDTPLPDSDPPESSLQGSGNHPRSWLTQPNWDVIRQYLGWIPIERCKATLKNTTQWFRATNFNRMKRHWKTRFPAANVPRWGENVASDTFFSDVPGGNYGIPSHAGATMMQLYTGTQSRLTEGFPMKKESQMPDTLRDFIRKRGAPDLLITDNAKAEISSSVKEILRMYSIGDFQSEPYQQNQNPAERRIQDIKAMSNTIMDRTGTPAQYWILCVLYVIYLWNHLAMGSLGDITPIQAATGIIPDISPLLHYRWWEPVYYYDDDAKFPSESREKRGRWCGVAENIGDVLTYYILTEDTGQVIAKSVIKSALDPQNINYRAEFPSDTPQERNPFIQSAADIAIPGLDPKELKLPKFSPDDLLGRTFLYDTTDDQRVRAEVIRKLATNDSLNHQNLQFLLKVGDDVEEVIGYVELCDAIEEQIQEEQDHPDRFWTYKEILDHQGPFSPSDPQWKGSLNNVQLLWSDGSKTWEPLNIILKDDPVTCANYALKNDLLSTHGWTSLRKLAKNKKKLFRMNKQLVRAHKNAGPKYKFGVEIPRNSKHARQLQEKLGHTKWTDAETKELNQLYDYSTFTDKGLRAPVPRGYRLIRVRFVYDCKHDLCHKARLVAGGHLTPADDSAYSGVVSLKSMRLALLIGELNGLTPMVGDIGNAYLEAYTNEKVCFYAGPEFGPLEGHLLIITKALYGLRSSGARFHDKLHDTLTDMGFRPSYADPDLWIRDAGNCYEYICVYVDDLMAIL
jgi:hypothetical protein